MNHTRSGRVGASDAPRRQRRPRQKLQPFPPIVTPVFQTIRLLHLMHVVVALVFMYFSYNFINSTIRKYDHQAVPDCSGNGTDALSPTSETCVGYFQFVRIRERNNYLTGTYLYGFFNLGYSIGSVAFTWWFWMTVQRLQPKSMAEVLQCLFAGTPKGAFMVSYAWKDEIPEGALPRRIASYFPTCWLDILHLVPGSNVKEACGEAAKGALFRFAFVSHRYFKSENCAIEWDGINAEPGKAFVFAYPDTPADRMREMKQRGHLVHELNDSTRADLISGEWFMTHFVDVGLARFFFERWTPAVNEKWLATMRFWFAEPDWTWLRISLPLTLISAATIIGNALIAWIFDFSLIFNAFGSCAVLFGLALALPFLLFLSSFFFMYYLKGTGFKNSRMPDVAMLIMLLHGMGVIETMRVFTNDPAVSRSSDMETLVRCGAIRLVDDVKDAHIRLLLVDSIATGEPTDAPASPKRTVSSFVHRDSENVQRRGGIDLALKDLEESLREAPETFIFWTNVGYLGLSQPLKDAFGSFLISESVPDAEFIGTKIFLRALEAHTSALTVGRYGFKRMFHAEEDSGTCRAFCCATTEPRAAPPAGPVSLVTTGKDAHFAVAPLALILPPIAPNAPLPSMREGIEDPFAPSEPVSPRSSD